MPLTPKWKFKAFSKDYCAPLSLNRALLGPYLVGRGGIGVLVPLDSNHWGSGTTIYGAWHEDAVRLSLSRARFAGHAWTRTVLA